MTRNATRPAAVALAMALTLALWAPTLSTRGTANAATIPQASAPIAPASIVLM